jgi:hypothetical protein
MKKNPLGCCAYAALLAVVLSLASCNMFGSYADIAPSAQSLHAIAIAHEAELRDLSLVLTAGATVTGEQAATLVWLAEQAKSLRDQAAEFERLVKGG